MQERRTDYGPPHYEQFLPPVIKENYGKNMVLFGNLEASDIENLPTEQFSEKVKIAIDEGTSGGWLKKGISGTGVI